ncbi:Phage hyaluronidase [Leuconostoc mesenteroides subsp. cremoris T26]|nr:Phage hyaluronidase [Leuconostoc mesenteroides subsp. cremoris T26]
MGNVAVYKKGTTNFFSQGLGLLSDVVSSNLKQTVSSTGNVGQKLEVEYPIDGYLVSELVEGAILRVSVSTNKSDYGVFEIVDTLKDDSGTITVYGDPYYNRILRMSFDNGGVFTKFPSVQSALDAAKQNITGFPADFNLISNLNTSVDLSENTYDTFGKFLEALNSAVHGNIKYSLNSIQIYSALGKDITDITLRDDMNTSSVKITTDFSGIINKVIPVLPVHDKQGNATDQTKVGTIVTSKYSNQFLDYWAGKVIHFDTQDIANTYFDRTKADRPVQTVDVDPIGLDDDFSTINIFDTIKLYSTRLDYTDKLRVSERVLDTLSENVISFKLGGSSVNIFNQINEQNNEIFNNVVKLTNAAISANGKGIDYFGQAKPSSPKEGDTWFWDDGTDFGIKQYTNGEWVDLVSSNTAEKISASVTEAVSQAKAHTDEVKQGLLSDISTAKSDALNTIAKEVTDRQNAVSELDTKATNAVDQAKKDINDTINALSVGGRNLLLGTENSATGVGHNVTNEPFGYYSLVGGKKLSDLYNQYGSSGYLTLSFDWVASGSTISGQIRPQWLGNPWGGNLDSQPIKPSSTHTSGHYETTISLNNWGYSTSVAGGIRFIQDNLQGNITISNLKLESGNKATDWTPAPEDVVLDYTTKDNKIKETITQYQETNDGHVSKLQTSVKTALEQIETKISQTDFNQKTGELSEKINEAKDTADKSLKTIADIQKADGKQDDKISEIERTAGEIKTTVSDLSTAQGEQSGYISTLQQSAKGFESTVTKVNNLAVGGRNLLLGTAKGFTGVGNNSTNGNFNEQGGKYYLAGGKKVSDLYNQYGSSGYLTISFDWVASGSTISGMFRPQWAGSPWEIPLKESGAIHPSNANTSGHYSGTFSLTTGGSANSIRFRQDYLQGNITITNLKLESGNTATDWTPAPEDVQYDIAQIKQTADSISYFVRDSSGNISSDFQTALSKTSIITGSTLATSIKKQTATQISSALTDNNGKIISLINQDSSGVQIAGKNIVLNGDTKVDGNFWAKQVNAVKVNATNITAGTLNASDVHIINLDVNRLVGNVSNWILSRWTSATGSKVTIDGNGLYFAPGTSRMTTHGFEAWRDDGGRYAAMGMVGSYSWETNKKINGMGLIAKYYDREHDDPGDPYRNENWGADTIAIGALAPEWGRGYDYVEPFLVFPANEETGNRYYPNNGVDTILTGRWLSIYTGLNMRGHAISHSSGYSLKENFDSVSGDIALEIFDNTDILTYDYKPDSNDMDDQTASGMRNKVGFVINDNGQSPYKIDNRLVRYGNSRDDTVTVGYLMAAVKELHAKVKKLESLNAQEKNNATRYK